MSSDTLYQPTDLENDTTKDFLDSLNDELEDISGQLLTLEREPGNKDIINALFRSIHSVKGNCRMCFFEPFSDFVHAMEEVVSEVRAGRLPFTPMLGEAISLSLDHVKIRAEELLRDSKTDIGLFLEIIPIYNQVKTSSITDTEVLMVKVIKLSGGQVAADVPLNSHRLSDATPRETETHSDPETDIEFFARMADLINTTSPHWEARSETQLNIALGINRYIARPIDTQQLTAAIYLHDLGMTFLPQDLVNKTQKYNPLEEKRVREHVLWSNDWVKRLPGWQVAADMILQHHERPDGKGYPLGLTSNAIGDGAQIVAMSDTFFALTNERSDRTYKKSLMRAITEINAYRDLQFKGEIIDAFNSWIREIYRKTSG